MASSRRMIKLTSSEGRSFQVEKAVAVQSQLIKNLIEADHTLDTVPLQNVTGRILDKVIEYCVKHAGDCTSLQEVRALNAWDAYFVTVDLDTLFDLVCAAHYLEIKSLVDLTCKTVADLVPPEDIREIKRVFNIPNNFIPEECPEVRRENEWSFE